MRAKHEPSEAMPILKDGGYFELRFELSGRNRLLLRMRLLRSDGLQVEGSWGNAKKKLEKLNRLKRTLIGRTQRWCLRED